MRLRNVTKRPKIKSENGRQNPTETELDNKKENNGHLRLMSGEAQRRAGLADGGTTQQAKAT